MGYYKKHFWDYYTPPRVKNCLRAGAVGAYVMSFCSVLLVLIEAYPFYLIDAGLVLGLGLGLHLAKSRACGVLLLVYLLIDKAAAMAGGGVGGVWYLIAAVQMVLYIMGITGAFSFQEKWKPAEAWYRSQIIAQTTPFGGQPPQYGQGGAAQNQNVPWQNGQPGYPPQQPWPMNQYGSGMQQPSQPPYEQSTGFDGYPAYYEAPSAQPQVTEQPAPGQENTGDGENVTKTVDNDR